ncbi:unnamed protein product [Phyllotreta striolata]|uniref:Ig-like domain-containing protein n=1 Tax=Phyllotreta striolata TaxID=444603 RepID=A0A9N9TFD9_PHYSR|nr:unnamed protein product [Phyllotreta striolata]
MHYFLVICSIVSLKRIAAIDSNHSLLLQEVPIGSDAILPCTSNTDNYLFQQWILDNNSSIGPTNNSKFDVGKFDYEVLSGNLLIRAVSKDDEGIYRCVSRSVRGGDTKMDKVRMVVLEDWEEVYEHDTKVNMFRILLILITLVLIAMGIYFLYTIWKDRYRYPTYLEQDDDEEDTEELFNNPGTSGISSEVESSIGGDRNPFVGHLNAGTDFESILEKTNE